MHNAALTLMAKRLMGERTSSGGPAGTEVLIGAGVAAVTGAGLTTGGGGGVHSGRSVIRGVFSLLQVHLWGSTSRYEDLTVEGCTGVGWALPIRVDDVEKWPWAALGDVVEISDSKVKDLVERGERAASLLSRERVLLPSGERAVLGRP